MVELKLDVSKRFMVLASIVLLFGAIGGVGFAAQNEFNLPLSWILGSDGTSVDVDENDRIDDSDHLEGYTASDLMAGGSGYTICHVEEANSCSEGNLIDVDGTFSVADSYVISGVVYTAMEANNAAGWTANGRPLKPSKIDSGLFHYALCCE